MASFALGSIALGDGAIVLVVPPVLVAWLGSEHAWVLWSCSARALVPCSFAGLRAMGWGTGLLNVVLIGFPFLKGKIEKGAVRKCRASKTVD